MQRAAWVTGTAMAVLLSAGPASAQRFHVPGELGQGELLYQVTAT